MSPSNSISFEKDYCPSVSLVLTRRSPWDQAMFLVHVSSDSPPALLCATVSCQVLPLTSVPQLLYAIDSMYMDHRIIAAVPACLA